MIDIKSRQRYQEEQRIKKLIGGIPKPKDKKLGEDEDFLKTMKYIAKRLDFQILLQMQMLKVLKNLKKNDADR